MKLKRKIKKLTDIEKAYRAAKESLPKIIDDSIAYNLRNLTDNELIRVYTLAQNFERYDYAKVVRRVMDRRGIDTFPHSF